MKKLLSLVCLLALISFPAYAGENAGLFEKLQKNGTLRCAYVNWSESLFAKDPNTGEYSGQGHELAEALAQTMGFKIDWVEEVSLANLYEGFRTGRYDAICTPIVQEPGGGVHATFLKPAYYASIYGYSRIDDDRFTPDELEKSLARANNPDITVISIDGSNATEIEKNHFPKSKIKSLPNMVGASEMIQEVLTGKADIVYQNPQMIDDFFSDQPEKLKKVTPPLMTYPISIIVLPREEKDTREWINLGMEMMLNVGTVDRILDKYDPDEKYYNRTAKPYR